MLVEQVQRRKWKLAFWPVAFCPHWRFGQWHTVHCCYVHWHFSIGVLSGYISGIGILGHGVLVIGISAVAFCPDTLKAWFTDRISTFLDRKPIQSFDKIVFYFMLIWKLTDTGKQVCIPAPLWSKFSPVRIPPPDPFQQIHLSCTGGCTWITNTSKPCPNKNILLRYLFIYGWMDLLQSVTKKFWIWSQVLARVKSQQDSQASIQ